MNRQELIHTIRDRKTFLCVGLDPDPNKIPAKFSECIDGVFEFLREIIDETRDTCVAYKPNTAFYEAFGAAGWNMLQEVIQYIGEDHFIIADAKRGDIGNTSRMYAKSVFKGLGADAITVAPYMGHDSVKPFLDFVDKWTIVLALTSNKGNQDFQYIKNGEDTFLYESVINEANKWGNPENLMFVVGATNPQEFKSIRKIVPNSFLLVPGIGAQGGDLSQVCENGMNNDVGLLVNSSRSILYASNDEKNFGSAARSQALTYQNQMKDLLEAKIKSQV